MLGAAQRDGSQSRLGSVNEVAFVPALLRDSPQPRCRLFQWNTCGRHAWGQLKEICRREKSNNSTDKRFGLGYYAC